MLIGKEAKSGFEAKCTSSEDLWLDFNHEPYTLSVFSHTFPSTGTEPSALINILPVLLSCK